MRTLLLSLTAILMAGGAASAQASAPPADTLRELAMRVTDLDARRQLASATAATVDSLVALYADSVVYEHPSARAVVRGKEVMRHGMTQYIGTVRAVHADVPRFIVGHGVVVVETSARMEVRDEGRWIPVRRHGIRVIEFDERGLVRRIIDYPW